MTSRPTEQELQNRLQRQLEFSQDKFAAICIWNGYITGLYEWGLIELDVYTRLEQLLPPGGNVETWELSSDEPADEEARKRILDYALERQAKKVSGC